MANLLQLLVEEHKRMRGMLDAFERELDAFQRAERPDYDILGDSIAYCHEYLDAWHHPKEEALLERLRDHDPAIAMESADLTSQHTDLAEKTKAMVEIFEAVRIGASFSRDGLVTGGQALMRAYHSHIEWEEEHFFPVVEQTLSPEDLAAIAVHFGETADPLAQNPIDGRYSALFDAIAEARMPEGCVPDRR